MELRPVSTVADNRTYRTISHSSQLLGVCPEGRIGDCPGNHPPMFTEDHRAIPPCGPRRSPRTRPRNHRRAVLRRGVPAPSYGGRPAYPMWPQATLGAGGGTSPSTPGWPRTARPTGAALPLIGLAHAADCHPDFYTHFSGRRSHREPRPFVFGGGDGANQVCRGWANVVEGHQTSHRDCQGEG